MNFYDVSTSQASTSALRISDKSEASDGIIDELVGMVVEILPTRSFTYKKGSRTGKTGKIRTIVMENAEQKQRGATVYKYRVVIWSNVLNKFAFISPGKTYRIDTFRQTYSYYGKYRKGFYDFDIHLLPKSNITSYCPDEEE